MSIDERPRTLTKDELNLAEFPIALPCHRSPKARTTIHIFETGLDQAGRPVQREWQVYPSHRGLPLATDEEVFLGLMHLLQLAGFTERHVFFTQNRLFNLLGWNTSRRSYERLEHSFDRLKGAVIKCKDSFWDNQDKCYVTRSFSILDSYALYRRDTRATETPFISSVSFSETIFNSFKAGFLKTLDFDLYLGLRFPIARKLLRLLDKKLHRGPVYEIELMRLAHRLALTDSTYPSDVKKHLKAPHDELIAAGFLKEVFFIRRGKATSIRYVMNPRENWMLPTKKVSTTLSPSSSLIGELVARGVSRGVAEALLKQHGEKSVADKLEVFDYLRAANSPMVAKNPAGFLRSSIEKDFAPPTGYITRAERQRLKEEQAAAEQSRRELEAALSKQDQEREAAFQSLWSSLSETDKETLEAQVLITLNTFARNQYRKEKDSGKIGPGHHAVRAGVQKLLESQNNSANV